MLMSIYVTLGIFLLLAVRDPAANRSLIAFGGWANLARDIKPANIFVTNPRQLCFSRHSSSLVGCKLGRTENRTLQSPGCMPFDAASFLGGVAQDFAERIGQRLDFPFAQDARENPNVGWHLRHGLSSSCRAQSWRGHSRWSTVRSAFVQEQFGDVDGQRC
jgi:hypothetical protein